MNLEYLRKEIDAVDSEIIKLFEKRMDIAAKIAQHKKESGKAVFDPAREQAKLDTVASLSREDLRIYTAGLFEKLFELSRFYQNTLLENNTEVKE